MPVLHVGQTIKTTLPLTAEGVFSGKTITIPAGSCGVIGMDKNVHFANGKIVEFNEDDPVTLTGKYYLNGIAQWIYLRLAARFNIEEMLDEYDESVDDFLDSIIDSLEDLGFENADDAVEEEE